MNLKLRNALLACGMLLSGCVNTISKKEQNTSFAKGWNQGDHSFTHPWFQTIIMFLGEALCIFGFLTQRCQANRDAMQQQKNIQHTETPGDVKNDSKSDEKPGQGVHAKLFQPILLVPTFLDLLGTSFGGIGLVYCAPSIWQMLRGSIIIFTGLLSWIFLKRPLKAFQIFAICFTMVGLVAVGCSSYLDSLDKAAASSSLSFSSDEESSSVPTESPGQVIMGICFILLGQFVAACQMVVEETFLKSRGLLAMHIVGLEGSFGFLLMLFIVLPALFFIPGDQQGPWYKNYENSIDALYQMYYNYNILIMGILYCLSIAFYNFFGLSVTKYLTCVHRTLIDACRTIFVWAFELIRWDDKGEKWTKWSFLELAGFIFLICGTLLYYGIVKLPCLFSYDTPQCKKEDADDEKKPLLVSSTDDDKETH